jgi:hypothetical protein
MMSTTAPTPATTPIPVQLSELEFTAFILPHLSMPKRGPKCKLGYYRVFNLILWVLYTGMQWKCLPVPHEAQGKPAIHYTTVYFDCLPQEVRIVVYTSSTEPIGCAVSNDRNEPVHCVAVASDTPAASATSSHTETPRARSWQCPAESAAR